MTLDLSPHRLSGIDRAGKQRVNESTGRADVQHPCLLAQLEHAPQRAHHVVAWLRTTIGHDWRRPVNRVMPSTATTIESRPRSRPRLATPIGRVRACGPN